MSDDLLAREKEFHRVNRELELKAKDLMKEVDFIMNSHAREKNLHDGCKSQQRPNSSFSERDSSEHLPRLVESTDIRKNSANSSIKESKLLQSSVKPCTLSEGDDSDEAIMPRIGNQKGGATVIRFLKAKTKMLHNELQTIKLEYKKNGDYSRELNEENKKLKEANDKWHSQSMSLKDALSTMESTNNSLRAKLQMRDNENSALKKEIVGLTKELKTLNHHSNSYDIRLNRSLEENERLRAALKFCQLEQKKLRDQSHKLEEENRMAVRNLEKQLSELLQAFKKQTSLIDNLKRQKVHMEAGTQIQFTEDEFAKLLDWKLEYCSLNFP